MKAKTMLSVLGLAVGGTLALVLLLVSGGTTGEYHSGGNLICFDCHTMHFSQQHQYDGTPGQGDPPLVGGPNEFLLRQPANMLCLACHNGQAELAPDVLGASANTTQPSEGREAGALNDPTLGTPYDTWKGHTLDTTDQPPGWNPSTVGLGTWYNNANGLECVNCHAQHGPATAYRNLGAYALGATASKFRPTYVINTTNDTTKDVWVNIAAGYVAGTHLSANFAPYYSRANIFFNRNDDVDNPGSVKTSNRMANFCSACHSNFHGSPGDSTVGGNPGTSNLEGFIRHPTSKITIGASGAAGYGGHSNLIRFQANANKVKVLDSTGGPTGTYSNPSPFCLSCHKAHGNQNPFGLIYMARSGGTITEEGTTTGDPKVGIRNLCGQCHGQGN